MIGVSGYINMNRNYLTNLTFGITFLNLTIVGIMALSFEPTFMTVVRFGSMLCNLFMGLMLLFNRRSVSLHSPLYRPYWLAMIVFNALVVKMVDGECPAISVSSLIFAFGLVLVAFSLFSLGRSFAVTPMSSQVKTGFMYAFVRHPMYLGESFMVLACVFAARTYWSLLLFALFLLAMVLRIHEEERLLLNFDDYRKYCSRTPWRLLPFVW